MRGKPEFTCYEFQMKRLQLINKLDTINKKESTRVLCNLIVRYILKWHDSSYSIVWYPFKEKGAFCFNNRVAN